MIKGYTNDYAVVIAMSGGVDSSVAAKLLADKVLSTTVAHPEALHLILFPGL